jgi:hypothetical protein
MEDGLVEREGLDRAEVAGPLHPDGVARVEEDLRNQVQALLGTVHDLDLVGGRREAEPPPVAVGDELPEREVAVRRRVLQRRPPVFGEDLAAASRIPQRRYRPNPADLLQTISPRDRRDPEELLEERLRTCPIRPAKR